MRSEQGVETESRKHVTVLFADIVGSTRLVTSLDPEDAKSFLETAINALIPSVRAAGGVVAKVMGDGVFCVFGAPRAQEDHAFRACHAALDILAASRQVMAPDGSVLQLRVGLSSGTAVVNATEDNGRLNLDAIGEVVNDAAHLEAAAEPGTVLISTATRQLAGHAIRVVPLEERNAFELQAVGSNPLDLLSEAASGQLPMLGRDREMGFLLGAAQDLSNGNGDFVSVVGEAGIGKTRLILEFCKQLQPTNIRVAVASSRALDQSDPNALLRRLVMSFLTIDQDQVTDPQRELADKLAVMHPELSEHADDIVWFLFSENDPEDQQAAEKRRYSALGALKRLVSTISNAGPLLVVIDNFQWSDASSRGFLKSISNMVEDAPILIVVFGREDVPDTRNAVRQVLQMRSLDRVLARQLLAHHFGRTSPSEELIDRIVDRADGNPRFLTEFARHIAERGEKHGADGPEQGVGVPDSVADLFEERIDKLPRDARRLLQIMAVYEHPATLETLEELSAQDAVSASQGMASLVDEGFVRETGFSPGTLYIVINPIVGEAAYRALLRDDKRRLHGQIYRSLQDRFDGQGRHRLMGYQAHRAGLLREAMESYFAAGLNAAAKLAYSESIHLLNLAVRSETRVVDRSPEIDEIAIDIRLSLREGLFAKSRFAEIGKRLSEAQAICDRIGDQNRSRLVRRHLVGNMVAQGQLEEALSQVETLITDNHVSGEHREVAELEFLQAQILAALGRYGDAFTSARSVLDAHLKHQGTRHELSTVTFALARMWMIWCAAELGRFEEVKFEVLDCQNDLSLERPPFFRILAGIATGLFWLRFGDVVLAADTLQSVLGLAKEDENLAWYNSVASPLGLALIRQGKADAALPLLQHAVAKDNGPQHGGGRGTQSVHLAMCWAALGEDRKAEDQARVAISHARQAGDSGTLAYGLHALGQLLDRQGLADAAEPFWVEAADVASTCEMKPLLNQLQSRAPNETGALK
ncbi:MAG: adenylate/guanylate cyclase domain-containing protein [Pseudomonadota bacterium]